ncbi:MAG: YkgJ family cysteine cluster protein [Candidatus Thorarchaeota archaeon]
MKTIEEKLKICSEQCGSKCCKSTQPVLTSEDFMRIKSNTDKIDWFEEIKENNDVIRLVRKKSESNDCIFLTNKGRCEIYECRPLDCILFPIFLKIKEREPRKYRIRWLVWYCPLSESIGINTLKLESKELVKTYLSSKPQYIFEYQTAMYKSGGYRRKHFLEEEDLTIDNQE